MEQRARHGWSYSLFAGIVACLVGIVFVWLNYLPNPALLVALVTTGAVLSARLGGWLAVLSGRRDHGWGAAVYTSLLYSIFCGAGGMIAIDLSEVPLQDAWAHLLRGETLSFLGRLAEQTAIGSLSVLTFGWWAIALACLIGTLLFHALLNVLDKRRTSQPPDSSPRTPT
jgi:hypothetical protein